MSELPGKRPLVALLAIVATVAVVGLMLRTMDGNSAFGAWASASPMPEPRYDHGVALLSDSRVLVAAGYSDVPAPQSLGSSATFDPLTRAWAASGALSVAREGAPLVALEDGGALIIGGEVPGEEHHIALQSAERFDPSNGSWRETPPMTTPRTHAAAVSLLDGRVLVIGGATGAPDGNRFLATAEIYDPIGNTWKPTRGELNVARDRHLAAVLRDGRVLVVGGEAPWGVDTLVTELYDPETDSFVIAGNTHAPPADSNPTVVRRRDREHDVQLPHHSISGNLLGGILLRYSGLG